MATSQMSEVLQHLRRTVLLRDGVGLSDEQLVGEYVDHGEQAALEALVQRHGPMVWGVCRRVLANYQDAEDAFQATFLVFVRKATSIASRNLIANWLFAVAHQTALKARATAAKRKARETQVTEMPEREVMDGGNNYDLKPLLDAELGRLPAKYRISILLCDLEGKSRKEAAWQLGVPEGTVAGWLARARAMLAKRLSRHGLNVSGGTLAAVLSQSVASARVPVPLMTSTINVVTQIAINRAAAGIVSPSVASLTEGVLNSMTMAKAKFAVIAFVLVGLLGAGVGLYPKLVSAPADEIKDPLQPVAAEPIAAAEEAPKKVVMGGLPKGRSPVQLLASMQDGKLVVKTEHMIVNVGERARSNQSGQDPGARANEVNVPPQERVITIQQEGVITIRRKPGLVGTYTYDLDEIRVIDTRGREINRKELPGLLKEETVAMASFGSDPIDPLHLRVLREGMLVFILPVSKNGVFPGVSFAPSGSLRVPMDPNEDVRPQDAPFDSISEE